MTTAAKSSRPKRSKQAALDQAEFEQVKSLALRLNKHQRDDVIKLLQASEAVQKETGLDDSNTMLLHSEIGTILEHVVGASILPYGIMMASLKLGPELREAAAALDAYLSKRHTGQEFVTKAERASAYKFLLSVIVSHMQNSLQIAVSMRPLIQQVANVGAIVDEAFPGYSSSGLLPVVMKAGAGLNPDKLLLAKVRTQTADDDDE